MTNLRLATPAVLRPLLRHLGGTNSSSSSSSSRPHAGATAAVATGGAATASRGGGGTTQQHFISQLLQPQQQHQQQGLGGLVQPQHQQQQGMWEAGHPFAGLNSTAALQLLRYCVSDLPPPPTPPPAVLGTAAGGEGGGGGGIGGQGEEQQPAAAALGVDFRGLGIMAGLGLRQLQADVEELMGSVVRGTGTQQHHTTAAAAAAAGAGGGGGREGDGGNERQQQQQQQQIVLVHLGSSHVQELIGLPVPTAAGDITLLGGRSSRGSALGFSAGGGGSGVLMVYPTACQPAPYTLHTKTPAAAGGFLHPQAVAALGEEMLQLPWVRTMLRLKYYGIEALARNIAGLCSEEWRAGHAAVQYSAHGRSGSSNGVAVAPGMVAVAAAVRGEVPAVAWDGGRAGGPTPGWLRDMWSVGLAVAAAAEAWGETTAQASAAAAAGGGGGDVWGPLDNWPLLPMADGRLLQVRYRELLMVVPVGMQQQQQEQEQQQQQQQLQEEGAEEEGSGMGSTGALDAATMVEWVSGGGEGREEGALIYGF